MPVDECYQQLLPEHKVISPHAIKTLYLGETKVDNTLLGLIDYHNEGTVEFWKQIKATGEEVLKVNINQTSFQPTTDHLCEKALLKLSDAA